MVMMMIMTILNSKINMACVLVTRIMREYGVVDK
jgi:hypothetical protein